MILSSVLTPALDVIAESLLALEERSGLYDEAIAARHAKCIWRLLPFVRSGFIHLHWLFITCSYLMDYHLYQLFSRSVLSPRPAKSASPFMR